MNYYIQGNKEKADQIKAAFEKLGIASNADRYNYKNDNVLYFTAGGMIHMIDANGAWANIIKTHPDYKELELPVEPKFKVGDWVAAIDDEGDMATEKIVSFSHNKVLLVDTDGCRTEYPKTELSNFHPWTLEDAKDGDILVTTKVRSCPFIYRKTSYNNNLAYYYAGIDGNGNFCEGCLKRTLFHFGSVENVVPATKEQRDLLFTKMKEAGYEWDADKKELRKIKPHYDIANFKPFDKVLVRCGDDDEWMIEFFCKYDTLVHTAPHRDYPFMGIGDSYSQCIPFNDDTKHLLGTTDMPSEEYINW